MNTRSPLRLLALISLALAAPLGRATEQIPRGGDVLPPLGPLHEAPISLVQPSLYDGAMSRQYDDASPNGWGPAGASGGPVYGWQIMPQGLIYRSYLAGAKESRFRSVWNHDQSGDNIWDITLGGNVGLLRYGTRGDGRPEGFQVGIEGAGLVRLNIDEDRDVDASDYRFGIPLTWGDAIHQVKFAFYHLSSHVGDEFLERNPGFVRFNYSRDVLVLGQSLYPQDNWRVYGEIGYAVAYDVCDPWELQFGVDWSPAGRTGGRGAPFAAVNGHLREEANFGGNIVAQAGWAWRRSPATGLFRVGVEYYNGKDDQFSFFNQSAEKVGFGIWYDY